MFCKHGTYVGDPYGPDHLCGLMVCMKAITVRLDDVTHQRVKLRAVQDGVAIQSLALVWFETYAAGGTVVASTETTVRPGRGLAAGDSPGKGSESLKGVRPEGGAGEVGSDNRADAAPPISPAPAAKPCSRKARHHINHGGNPCPECGWPK